MRYSEVRLCVWEDFPANKTFAFRPIATCSNSFCHCRSSHYHLDVLRHSYTGILILWFFKNFFIAFAFFICFHIVHKWNLSFRFVSLLERSITLFHEYTASGTALDTSQCNRLRKIFFELHILIGWYVLGVSLLTHWKCLVKYILMTSFSLLNFQIASEITICLF